MFPVFGDGNYRVQPIYAEDLAAQAVAAGSKSENTVADAAGPETFTFKELLRLLAKVVGIRVRLVHTPPAVGYALTRLVGLLLRDMVLTRGGIDDVRWCADGHNRAGRLAGRKLGHVPASQGVRVEPQFPPGAGAPLPGERS